VLVKKEQKQQSNAKGRKQQQINIVLPCVLSRTAKKGQVTAKYSNKKQQSTQWGVPVKTLHQSIWKGEFALVKRTKTAIKCKRQETTTNNVTCKIQKKAINPVVCTCKKNLASINLEGGIVLVGKRRKTTIEHKRQEQTTNQHCITLCAYPEHHKRAKQQQNTATKTTINPVGCACKKEPFVNQSGRGRLH